MKKSKIRCPCCGRDIIVEFTDTNEITGVFFDGIKISTDKALEKYGVCFGEKGGVYNE